MAQRKATKGRKSGQKRPARKAAARGGKKGGAKKSRARGAASSARTNARVAQLEAENRRLRDELASLRRDEERAARPAESEELGEPTLPFGE